MPPMEGTGMGWLEKWKELNYRKCGCSIHSPKILEFCWFMQCLNVLTKDFAPLLTLLAGIARGFWGYHWVAVVVNQCGLLRLSFKNKSARELLGTEWSALMLTPYCCSSVFYMDDLMFFSFLPLGSWWIITMVCLMSPLSFFIGSNWGIQPVASQWCFQRIEVGRHWWNTVDYYDWDPGTHSCQIYNICIIVYIYTYYYNNVYTCVSPKPGYATKLQFNRTIGTMIS